MELWERPHILYYSRGFGLWEGKPVAKGLEQGIEQFLVKTEPFYAEVSGEIGLFKAAAASKMPVMLKGPTGCG